MMDDKPIVNVKIEENRIYVRRINRKMINYVCDMYDITLKTDTVSNLQYVDVKDITTFFNALTRSGFHVFII